MSIKLFFQINLNIFQIIEPKQSEIPIHLFEDKKISQQIALSLQQFGLQNGELYQILNNMGKICSKQKDKGQESKPIRKPAKISTYMDDSELEKVNEIKQFLTLSIHNTIPLSSKENCGNLKESSKAKAITDFKVVRGLGKGAFGQVFMVKDTANGKKTIDLKKMYAMKIILKESIKSPEDRINTLSQRLILEAMDHPFIVKLHYAFQSDRKLYLLCDLMPGGELFYLLRRNRKFPEQVAKFYAAEILLAIEYLHSRNIMYRDLKPENILLDCEGHIKITDFGLSKVCISDRQVTFSICGTPEYIAPEVIRGKGYTQTADWFSFGSLLYDMLTGRPPFYSSNKNDIIRNITTKNVPLPPFLSEQAKSLLKGLFALKPKQRLGWAGDGEQIKKHPFFANVDFAQILKKEVSAPIGFKQSLNLQGFDIDFQGSYHSTVNIDQSRKQDELIFDGFTYYKPHYSTYRKQYQVSHTSSIREVRSSKRCKSKTPEKKYSNEEKSSPFKEKSEKKSQNREQKVEEVFKQIKREQIPIEEIVNTKE